MSDQKTKKKWQKKDTGDYYRLDNSDLYFKKIVKLEIYIHRLAFTEETDLADYIEYRLNLDRGTHGLIHLEAIDFEDETEKKDNEISNDT